MKKSIILLSLAIGLLFTACEQDDNLLINESDTKQVALQEEVPEIIASDAMGTPVRIDSFRLSESEAQTRSTWQYLTGMSYTSSTGWYNLGYVSESYLEDFDVQAVVSSQNYTGAIITHGWSPLRWINGYHTYSNTSTSLVLTLDDLQSNESRGYFHTYSWTNNTSYQVDFYVRPKATANVAPNTDDYPYTGTDACHINNGCDGDSWNFCKSNCTSWVAWKVNQASGYTSLGQGASNYPFYNQMTSPALSHAKNWDTRLASIGYAVNNNPAAGCLAQWNETSSNQYGHIAYVHSVSSNGSVTISEYNYSPLCEYDTRTISTSSSNYPDNFIHIQD